MIDFPKSTVVHRRLPKEAFYKHLSLAATLKARFVTDVDRIVVENSLTKKNLNLAKESEIKESAGSLSQQVVPDRMDERTGSVTEAFRRYAK